MASAAQIEDHNQPARLQFSLVVIGFSSIVAQIVLMRELLVVFQGNELLIGIILAVWLLWTGVGSSVLGRLRPTFSSQKMLLLLFGAESLALYGAIFLVRTSRAYWHAQPGELLGPTPMVLTALVSLAVFCPISGWLFAAGSRYLANSSDAMAEGANAMYFLEAIGSTAGGLVTSVVFIKFLDSIQIAAIVAIANLIAAVWIGVDRIRTRAIIFAVIAGTGIVVLMFSHRIEGKWAAQSWPGFRILATDTSPYGSLTVLESGTSRSLIQNGSVLFTYPDPASAEEAAHFAMLQHPTPAAVLLIGGGLNGSLAEILKYPGVNAIDYVELDPAVIRLARNYFPSPSLAPLADSRVRMHEMDGRLFLNTTDQHFDVIILNLPDPQTAQINRFYTEEFFRQTSRHLNSNGVFAFQVRASEEYLSPATADLLRCLALTLRKVFPNVATIPGETVHFLATPEAGQLNTVPEHLGRRISEQHLQTMFVSPYFLPFRMSLERRNALEEQLRPTEETRVNRDFNPIAYFMSLELWSSQFSQRYRTLFQAIAQTGLKTVFAIVTLISALLAGLLSWTHDSERRTRRAIGFAVTLMGLMMMGSQIILLLGFQAVFGYVFDELAIIIAGFMAGMASGAWVGLATSRTHGVQVDSETKRLLRTQIAATAVVLSLTPAISYLGRLGESGPRDTFRISIVGCLEWIPRRVPVPCCHASLLWYSKPQSVTRASVRIRSDRCRRRGHCAQRFFASAIRFYSHSRACGCR
jgi:spermidine synthase